MYNENLMGKYQGVKIDWQDSLDLECIATQCALLNGISAQLRIDHFSKCWECEANVCEWMGGWESLNTLRMLFLHYGTMALWLSRLVAKVWFIDILQFQFQPGWASKWRCGCSGGTWNTESRLFAFSGVTLRFMLGWTIVFEVRSVTGLSWQFDMIQVTKELAIEKQGKIRRHPNTKWRDLSKHKVTQICQDHHWSRLENGDGFGFMELDRRYTVYLKEATHSWKRGTPELSFCVGKKGWLGGGVYPEVDAATDADSRCLTTIIRAGCQSHCAHGRNNGYCTFRYRWMG